MQKRIIALAISAAFAAPAFADTVNVTVYGQAHLSYDQYSGDAATTAAGTQNGGNVAPGASRIGFKGSEDIGDGLKAVFQYESAVRLDGNAALLGAERDTYIGVAGNFGTVLAGRLPLANQYANDANFFAAKVGDAGNFSGANGISSRINGAVAYASPKFGGFSGLIAYVANTNQAAGGAQNAANKASSYTLRGDYAEGGIKAGLSYQSLATDSTKSAARIIAASGGYDFGVARVAAQYVRNTDIGQVAGANQNIIVLGGSFKLGEADSLSAQYTKAGNKGATANSGATGFAVGYDHNLSKRSTIYAAYAIVKNDVNAAFLATGYAHGGVTAPTAGEDPKVLSVGVIHNF